MSRHSSTTQLTSFQPTVRLESSRLFSLVVLLGPAFGYITGTYTPCLQPVKNALLYSFCGVIKAEARQTDAGEPNKAGSSLPFHARVLHNRSFPARFSVLFLARPDFASKACLSVFRPELLKY